MGIYGERDAEGGIGERSLAAGQVSDEEVVRSPGIEVAGPLTYRGTPSQLDEAFD